MLDSSLPDLDLLYQKINAQHFDGQLSSCRFRWSRRLTRAAGTIDVRNRVISLSVPLIIDAFSSPNEYCIGGVPCNSPETAIVEILKHEMIHLWLFELGKPCGHTREFKIKAREMGHSAIRHTITRPQPSGGWQYSCSHCGSTLWRRRRFGRAVACGLCCKTFNGGAFDAKYRLRGRRLN